MTLQEQFEKETGQPAIVGHSLLYVHNNAYVKWLESCVESLQSANQWVSVKDRLPELLEDIRDAIETDKQTLLKTYGITGIGAKGHYRSSMIVDEKFKSFINRLPAAPVKEGEI